MPELYAVIGHPVSHSKSPQIHAAFARDCGLDMNYEAIDGLEGESALAQAVEQFRQRGGKGVNVTLPFKLEALRMADFPEPAARLAGAANALYWDERGIFANNFDGAGLVRDLQDNLGCALAGARVLLLGAGGATRGALLPLSQAGVAAITLANRSSGKARELAAFFAEQAAQQGCTVSAVGLDDPALNSGPPFDVAINATSASLSRSAPALGARALSGVRLAYDMVYGMGLTPFLRQAKEAAVPQLADGIGMLVEQAAETFAWWAGVRPATRGIIAQLSRPLV